MTWFKVDDTFALHAKSVDAGNAAIGLWVRAGSWASQQLTDGFIPAYIVTTLGTHAQASQLVRVGLWVRCEHDGQRGYAFHEWSERQPTREAVQADREASKDRQKRARDRARKARDQQERPDVGAESQDTATDASRRDTSVSHGEVQAASRSPRPDPTRPDPSVVPSELLGGGDTRGESPPRARPNDAPPDRCPRHADVADPPPCGACRDARLAHERQEAETAQARRDAGLVVGGQECPEHPGERAGLCRRCVAAADPPPENLRDELRAARRARRVS